MEKIGIMGGTFDPIHMAHLVLAMQCADDFKLDKVIFIPTGQPPHKSDRRVSLSLHRGNMTKLAIENNAKFIYSDIEINRIGDTYTAETLEELHKTYNNAEFYFIMGADSFMYLDKWFNPERIIKLSKIIVAARDNIGEDMLLNKGNELKSKFGGEFHIIRTPNLEISSNMLRSNISAGKSVQYYVTNEVYKYIKEKKLYL
jgi:nicotinate (nicotinamide) nucleotide adenylyltransferase